MEFFSKKYTILVNDEPLTIITKNGEVKKATFMDKKVAFELDKKTVEDLKKYPSKIINGSNLEKNDVFTKNLSKMLEQNLKRAIERKDMKVLSRFAQSNIVPEAMETRFMEAINRPRGLRGMLTNALNKTNNLIQTMATKIDRYFDKMKMQTANKKLDEHLQKYQNKYMNQVQNITKDEKNKIVDAKLTKLADTFLNQNPELKTDMDLELNHKHKAKADEYFKQAAAQGFSSRDAKIALYQAADKYLFQERSMELYESKNRISDLEREIQQLKRQQSMKNETLEDFKTLSTGVDAIKAIDLLTQNKEYQNLSPKEQVAFENQTIFKQEPVQDRAKELEAIAKELQQPQQSKILSFTKEELNNEWKVAQAQNRSSEIPSSKFMNLSAIKFNGVSKSKLKEYSKQMNEMRENGKNVPSKEKVTEFIQGSLKNAEHLQDYGYVKETQPGEYKFVDEKSKNVLYTQLKNNEQVIDMKSRLQDLSSEKSFDKLIKSDGSIDVEKVALYASKLSQIAELAAQKPNVNISREELKRDSQLINSQNKTQDKGQSR